MVRYINAHIFITIVLVMIMYTSSERSYFSLFNDTSVVLTCNDRNYGNYLFKTDFFTFIF